MVLWDHVTNKMFYISIFTMATKHGKMVTYVEWLPPRNSHNPSNMWSREVMWQIKNISPIPQCQWSLNLLGWWHTVMSSHTYIRMTPQWGGLVRSRDKLNALHFHLQNTHGYQTRQGTGLPLEASALNGILTIWKIYISTFTRLMVTKLGRVEFQQANA